MFFADIKVSLKCQKYQGRELETCTLHKGLGHGKHCFPFDVDGLGLFSVVLSNPLQLSWLVHLGGEHVKKKLIFFSCLICAMCTLGSVLVFWP